MDTITINVDTIVNHGRLVYPKDRSAKHPAILALHGWGSMNHLDIERERAIIDSGFIYLTFDLRGHGKTKDLFTTSTRAEHLRDATAAYDFLVKQPGVDESKIGIVGFSYGGYIAVLLTALRSISFLALRSPAIYPHENFDVPKVLLRSLQNLEEYRKTKITAKDNQLFQYAEKYPGDVLLVEAGNDSVVPKEVLENYQAAFLTAKSVICRTIPDADHSLTDEKWKEAYISILVLWLKQFV